jgi:hypothetical protein
MRTGSGLFALIMGIVMALVWIVLIATGQHDFRTAPLESASLLAAEALTALTLIVGGIGVLVRKQWATVIHIASLGMMLYTSLNSIGVFAQAGVLPASIFFAMLTLATIALILVWASHAL